jgi:hypothetical protein
MTMSKVFWALLTALLLTVIWTKDTFAEQYYFKYGLQAPGSNRDQKIFGLGYQNEILADFIYSGEVDILSVPSNPSPASYFASAGLGLKLDFNTTFAAVTWGPAYLSQPDQELGGRFQLTQDFTLGIQDGYSTIGVGYKHISSAGIEKPNRGKDFLYLRIGVKF